MCHSNSCCSAATRGAYAAVDTGVRAIEGFGRCFACRSGESELRTLPVGMLPSDMVAAEVAAHDDVSEEGERGRGGPRGIHAERALNRSTATSPVPLVAA